MAPPSNPQAPGTETIGPPPEARVSVRPWHALPGDEVLAALGSGPRGLEPDEAAARLAADGPNRLAEKPPRSPWKVLLDQLMSPLIAILALAAVAAYFFGEGFDVWVILAVVLLNAGLGFVLERRASGAIAALMRMTSPRARVRRAGEMVELDADAVVVGDLLVLETGDRVAADARILRESELTIDESGLTGESVPAEKDEGPVPGGAEVALGDRAGMAYMNTAVTTGRGLAVVVATGMATEMGRIAQAVSEADTTAPIQRRLHRFGGTLGLTICGIVAIVMGLGLLLGRPAGEMFYVAISLAVAAIPEGLPLVVSALFAIGVTRMARRHALIRRLPAVEALGAATVIGSDKTGTLTRNEMTVRRLWIGMRDFAVGGEGYAPEGAIEPPIDEGQQGLFWLGACARLANDALLEAEDGSRPEGGADRAGGGNWRVVGDPTEGALLSLASKLRVDPDWRRVQEIPFSAERKWMATLNRDPDGRLVAFAKGALERVLPMAVAWMDADGATHPLDEAGRRRVHAAAEAMADQALRVLALGMVADVDHAEAMSGDLLNGRLVLVGLVGMIDPPRPEAVPAVATCREAGIRVLMITGDHRATAAAIAKQVGISGPDDAVVEGAQLEAMDDAALDAALARSSVFARVNPSHKLRIVRALQRRGEIVAMTGDGVNDAPALSQADIGIAMGITGTEVAKGAAGMVLADDNFATIVSAVEQGRTIGGNLRKVVAYLMATCTANIAVIGGAIVTNLPLPMTAVMLLWINLIGTGILDKTLALEQAEPDAMHRPPRPPQEPLVTGESLARLLFWGLFMAAVTLAIFTWELQRGTGLAQARTGAFTTMAFFQCFSAFVHRSDERSLLALPPNRWMYGGLVLALASQLLAVYWGPFQLVLGTVAMPPLEFLGTIGVAASLLVVSEAYKWVMRRHNGS